MALRRSRAVKQQTTAMMSQKNVLSEQVNVLSKRDAENNITDVPPAKKKRTAFGDLTNKDGFDQALAKKKALKKTTTTIGQKKKKTELIIVPKSESKQTKTGDVSWEVIELSQGSQASQNSQVSTASQPLTSSLEPPVVSQETKSDIEQVEKHVQQINLKNSQTAPEKELACHDYIDVDADDVNDPFQVGLYAAHIFEYYKKRESRFALDDYLPRQPDITPAMRAVLVDWLVEVQENFELNHETLYLAVKLVDHLLASGRSRLQRDRLQLIGATALFSAAKFDERCPPVVDDFLYICDGAYSREELLETEREILRAMRFDIGLPLSYRFLRRYAKCAHANMKTLTLARYFLESSLLNYSFVPESDSKLAAATLLVALVRKVNADDDCINLWDATMRHYTGYRASELCDLAVRVNSNLSNPAHRNLTTVRTKYSHRVFSEAAKIPVLSTTKLVELITLADRDPTTTDTQH